ncbi:MAG: PilN domain-containing protein [Nitrospiraceae bacterium]
MERLRRMVDELVQPPPGLTLNFSSYTSPLAGPIRWGCIVASAVLVWAVAWDLVELWGVADETRVIEQSLAKLREQDAQVAGASSAGRVDVAALDGVSAGSGKLATEVAFVNRLVEKRAFSWTRFLSELEGALPATVGVQSVKMDPAGTVVQLAGAALSFEALTAFVTQLEDHPSFHEPVLKQHQQREDGLVEFDVTLVYAPTNSRR